MSPRKKAVEEDDLDDIVDDLDDLDDEDFEDDDEVEDEEEDLDEEEEDEDPDEAPKKSRSRSKSKKKAAAKKPVGVGTTELAADADITPRALRMFLRASEYQPRDDREGRYFWKSKNDPEYKKILKEVKAGAAKKVNDERIADLKARKSKKTTARAKKTTARKGRARAKAKA